ncbi:MAG: GNAT family N-acetyltransferase [Thermoanaerobaculia bacterium]
MIEVRDAAAGPEALAAFLSLPDAVYRGDARYKATPRADVLASLRRPDFTGAQSERVALEAGEPVARMVARRSPALRDDAGRPLGLLGFFEALDGHPEAVARLFAESLQWLREAGAGDIVGPMDGDTWHRYRLNVGPWDDPPFLLEPYNPPWYAPLWTANGFAVLERYLSKQVDPAAVVAHLEARRGEALAAGYTLRPLDLSRFESELGTIYELSRRIFSGNFLYTEIPRDEFLKLYAGARPLLDPGLVPFARSPAGEDVGFLFAYPDPFHAGAVDFKTLGVLPAHRRSGVAAALFHEGHRHALGKGCRLANHCLFREGNPSGDLDGGAGRILRRYELYRWKD